MPRRGLSEPWPDGAEVPFCRLDIRASMCGIMLVSRNPMLIEKTSLPAFPSNSGHPDTVSYG
ncbi:MAG: hypothetical protein BGO99_11920 [Nitrosospira sp. 56-18]|nr:MAG: hypothetical protein BGO99_11920 [Nitrosospira sp. 56-18]